MDNGFDIYTLLFLILAVVIFLRLKNVLGRRTGNERQHHDPYTASDDKSNGAQRGTQDTVVPMHPGQSLEIAEDSVSIEDRMKDFAPKGSPLASGLMAIGKADRNFDPALFLSGAKEAYEMIVVAFAEGNKRALRQLLGNDVYEGFVGAIEERTERGERVDSSFIGIDKTDMIEAELKRKSALITVKFISQLITSTLDKKGKVIDGDPKKVREVTDIWTFSRDVSTRDPNWKLVATEAAN
jgi:predicted lipid-binding transport protein (Tim44 family)